MIELKLFYPKLTKFNWFLCSQRYYDNRFATIVLDPNIELFDKNNGKTYHPLNDEIKLLIVSDYENKIKLKNEGIEMKCVDKTYEISDECLLLKEDNLNKLYDYAVSNGYNGIVYRLCSCDNKSELLCNEVVFMVEEKSMKENNSKDGMCKIIEYAIKHNDEFRLNNNKFPTILQIKKGLEKHSCSKISKKIYSLV